MHVPAARRHRRQKIGATFQKGVLTVIHKTPEAQIAIQAK
jgi:HSP20 family molecular chaperone IbpA